MTITTRLALIWYVLTRLKRLDLLVLNLSLLSFLGSIVAITLVDPGIALLVSIGALLVAIVVQIWGINQYAQTTISDLGLIRYDSLNGDISATGMALAQLKFQPKDQELGFEAVTFSNGEAIVTSKRINKWLLGTPLVPIELKEHYEVSILNELRLHWDDFRNFLILYAHRPGRLFNGSKIALVSRFGPDEDRVFLGQTSYFTTLITNEASMYGIQKLGRTLKDFRLLFPAVLSKEPSLQSLEASGMSNHIGISLLVMSSDGFIVFWVGSDKTRHSIGEIIPSATGSLDWSDIRESKSKNLIDIVRFGMERELAEETNLKIHMDRSQMNQEHDGIKILGYYRWLKRGGKPEFIGVVKIAARYHEFSANLAEVEKLRTDGRRQQDIQIVSVGDLRALCTEYLGNSYVHASVPLAATLWRINEILERDVCDEERRILVETLGLREQ